MLDHQRSLRSGRALSLWIALLAGLFVVGLIVFATQKPPATARASDGTAAPAVATANPEAALESVVTSNRRTTASEPVSVLDAKPETISPRGSIRGQVRRVGEPEPVSYDGFARIAA